MRVRKDLWRRVRENCGMDEKNSKLINFVLEEWLKVRKSIEENERLRERLAELTGKCRQAEREEKKVRRKYEKIKEKYEVNRSGYKRLKEEYDRLLKNPIVKERIVYKQDRRTIEVLNSKIEKLKKRNWKAQRRITQIVGEKNTLERKVLELEKALDDLERKSFAILCVGDSVHSRDFLGKLEFELVDSSSYYHWKERKEEFETNRNLQDRPYVMKLVE